MFKSRRKKDPSAPELTCESCRYFNNRPEWLEKSIKGMTVFSSGYASVKAADGTCELKGIYLTPVKACQCQEFELATTIHPV